MEYTVSANAKKFGDIFVYSFHIINKLLYGYRIRNTNNSKPCGYLAYLLQECRRSYLLFNACLRKQCIPGRNASQASAWCEASIVHEHNMPWSTCGTQGQHYIVFVVEGEYFHGLNANCMFQLCMIFDPIGRSIYMYLKFTSQFRLNLRKTHIHQGP